MNKRTGRFMGGAEGEGRRSAMIKYNLKNKGGTKTDRLQIKEAIKRRNKIRN